MKKTDNYEVDTCGTFLIALMVGGMVWACATLLAGCTTTQHQQNKPAPKEENVRDLRLDGMPHGRFF